MSIPLQRFIKKSTKCNIEIVGFDSAKKLTIIKELKAMFSLGLKEAKELIEKLPATIKSGIPNEEGETLKEKLTSFGCDVKMS